jgi:hypothetical protein
MISATGLIPAMAIPTALPAMQASETRSRPKVAKRPLVT